MIEGKLKSEIPGELDMKFQHYEHIPYSVAGAFGAYTGYSLAASKKCIRESHLGIHPFLFDSFV